ncbi:MAG TPA: o-succinylbenzoate--CoA ligase, partial [Alicycliphilus sp.]|nr:o-succinylbenzoate--CoA ligase [Alicycliphilus sp.]
MARLDTPVQETPVGGPPPDLCEWVHGPLAHWARVRPDALALANESRSLSFAELHARVQAQARKLDAEGAPVTVLLQGQGGTLEELVAFLGVVASGRCAAMGDPQWPAGVAAAVA